LSRWETETVSHQASVSAVRGHGLSAGSGSVALRTDDMVSYALQWGRLQLTREAGECDPPKVGPSE